MRQSIQYAVSLLGVRMPRIPWSAAESQRCLRHVVMFQWVPSTTAEEIEHAASGLRDLVGVIPEIRSYTCGADLRLAEPRLDFVVVADFDDANGWRAYDSHPAHNLVRSQRMAHIIAARAAVQFDLQITPG